MTLKINSTFQAVIKRSSSGFYCCTLQLTISEFNKNYPTFIGFCTSGISWFCISLTCLKFLTSCQELFALAESKLVRKEDERNHPAEAEILTA